MNIDDIINNISKIHGRWETACMQVLPDVAIGRQKNFSKFHVLLNSFIYENLISVINFFPIGKSVPKYIFEGLRHRHLIEILPVSEVMILGGRNEFFYCYKKGYKFHWIGYISKTFQLYIWADKRKPFYKAVQCIIKIFMKHANEKKYLFLWEDSQPTGMTLSASLKSIPYLNIICIGHGLLGNYRGVRFIPEGLSCRFNLVWDKSQVKLFTGSDEINTATFVLGLPYDIVRSQALSRHVILVGHVGRGSDSIEYFYSLYHFSKIYRFLINSGFLVSFRPHPQDDVGYISKIFNSVNIQDKHQLFSSGRMAYIGFSSSLLYEAGQFGNIVIALDSSPLSCKVEFDADSIILEGDYDNLPLILSNLFDARSIEVDTDIGSLSSRFYNCLLQIDEFNAK